MGYKSTKDIIKFVNNYRINHGVLKDEKEIERFIGELQSIISEMDFTVSDDVTVIGYTGKSNGVVAWKIVEHIAANPDNSVTYISNLPAGELLSDEFERRQLKKALILLLNDYEDAYDGSTKVKSTWQMKCELCISENIWE